MTRVLVVDDDRNLLRMICKSLEQDGWDVVPAVNLGEARAKPGTFDAVVADIGLPNGDGRELRDEYRGVPFLLISGAPVDEPEEVSRGLVPFLPKPFTVGQLRDAVEGILR